MDINYSLKPGRLTTEKFEIMKTHTTSGTQLDPELVEVFIKLQDSLDALWASLQD